MKPFPRRSGAAAALLLFCLGLPRAGAAPPPLVVVSLDAFRWDYVELHPDAAPRLRQLAHEGVSARELIPVYPSNTFPNHYSIATGLYPAHHGIVNNDFFDPGSGQFFHYNVSASARQSRWWGGEPIWVTAVKQGLKSACSEWPGCEAAIEGVRPTYVEPFTTLERVHDESRLARIVDWLSLPPDRRPSVILFYLEEGNAAGHKYGPDAPEIVATIRLLDRRVGAIEDSLKAAGIRANLVVVSDHGMTGISAERVLVLEDYVDGPSVQVDFHNPVAGLRPLKGSPEELVRQLARMPHARAYLAKDAPAPFGSAEYWRRLLHPSAYLPERLHLEGNARIPPVIVMPDEGWEIQPRAYFNTYRSRMNHGDHGFDPALRSMHGILLASGPSFKDNGAVTAPVENIHLYDLFCALLGLKPAPNDGDDRLARAMLR